MAAANSHAHGGRTRSNRRPRPGLRRLRMLGLAGCVLLAAASFAAGALPAAPTSQAQALWGDGPAFRIGLLAYVAGLVLVGTAWWRLGAAFRAGAGPGLQWTLVTGALWAAPLLVAAPLGSRDVYAYACQGAAWLDGHDPYTTGAATAGCPWVASVPPLWQDTTTPYGPLALLISAAAVLLARLVATGEAAQLLVAVGVLRLAAVAGMLLVAAYLPRLARACGTDPAAATWLGLVTPLVGLHAVAGAHNDAVVAGLVVAALALAVPLSPGPSARWWWVGVPLALAVAVKITAVVVVPFALLLVAASHRRYGRAVVVAAVAVATYLLLMLVTGLDLGWLTALADTGALVQWSSVPTAVGMAVGYALWAWPQTYDVAITAARLVGLAVLATLAAVMVARAWRHARQPAQVVLAAGVVLAAVVLFGPVVYPWYALVPLAVLAAALAPSAATHRLHPTAQGVDQTGRGDRWLAVATLAATALVLPSGLGVPVLTKLPGAVVVTLAVVAWGWWAWRRRPAGGPHRWLGRRRGLDAPDG